MKAYFKHQTTPDGQSWRCGYCFKPFDAKAPAMVYCCIDCQTEAKRLPTEVLNLRYEVADLSGFVCSICRSENANLVVMGLLTAKITPGSSLQVACSNCAKGQPDLFSVRRRKVKRTLAEDLLLV